MMKNKVSSIRISSIILAVIYIAMGISYMIDGADPTSRFYYVDNILLRIMGFFFLLASIGVFIRKELARKTMVLLCILSILEFIITFDTGIVTTFDIIGMALLVILLYVPCILFFMNPKVKQYFIHRGEMNLQEDIEDNKEHSHFGVASFIAGIVNVVIVTILILSTNYFSELLGLGEETLEFQLAAIVVLLLYIANFISSLVGLSLGIVGTLAKNKKKSFSLWGLALNVIALFIYFLVIIAIIFGV